MKNLLLFLPALLVSFCTPIMISPVNAADQTLNGGSAAVNCVPNTGIALWSLRTFDDPMIFVNTTVRFSQGATFQQTYGTAPSFEQDGAESSDDPTEQFVTYGGNALGTYTSFTIPVFQDNCN
jgi:hypothetical protein